MTMFDPPAPERSKPLPAYEVHLVLYRSGVTATVFAIGYARGRRRVIARVNKGLLPPPKWAATEESQVAFLLRQLADRL